MWCTSPSLLSELCFTLDRKQKEPLKSRQSLFRAGPMTKTIPSNGFNPSSDCNSFDLRRTNGKSHWTEGLADCFTKDQPLFCAGPIRKTIHSNRFNFCFTLDRHTNKTSKSRQPLFRVRPMKTKKPRNSFNPCCTQDRTQKETSKACQPLFHAGPIPGRDIEIAPTPDSRRTKHKKRHQNRANPCFTPSQVQEETSKLRQPLFRQGPTTKNTSQAQMY